MTSKLEILTREFLKSYFPKYKPIYNWRPDFLKNEKTGRNLELDIYYPDLMVAIEVNGPQHLLNENVEREVFKITKCAEEGIYLHSVYTNNDIRELKKELIFFFDKAPRITRNKLGNSRIKKILGKLKYIKIPKEVIGEIKKYKPSETFQGGFFKKVYEQLHRQKLGIEEISGEEAQRREIESVRKRRQERESMI